MTNDEIRVLPIGTTFGRCPKCRKPARFFHYRWMGFEGCDHVEITHLSTGGFECVPKKPWISAAVMENAFFIFIGFCLGFITAIEVYF